jgi:hypothetical protein
MIVEIAVEAILRTPSMIAMEIVSMIPMPMAFVMRMSQGDANQAMRRRYAIMTTQQNFTTNPFVSPLMYVVIVVETLPLLRSMRTEISPLQLAHQATLLVSMALLEPAIVKATCLYPATIATVTLLSMLIKMASLILRRSLVARTKMLAITMQTQGTQNLYC